MSKTPLHDELRADAFAVMEAIETLGKTSGVFRDTHEFASLRDRARVWHDALLRAAAMVRQRYESGDA